jgi:hypothetical protein
MVGLCVLFNLVLSVEQFKTQHPSPQAPAGLSPDEVTNWKDPQCSRLYKVYGSSSSILFFVLSIVLMIAILGLIKQMKKDNTQVFLNQQRTLVWLFFFFTISFLSQTAL